MSHAENLVLPPITAPKYSAALPFLREPQLRLRLIRSALYGLRYTCGDCFRLIPKSITLCVLTLAVWKLGRPHRKFRPFEVGLNPAVKKARLNELLINAHVPEEALSMLAEMEIAFGLNPAVGEHSSLRT